MHAHSPGTRSLSKTFMLRVVARLLAFAAIMSNAGLADAQAYPGKPVRIVTASAGSNSDFLARLIAQGISGPLGQPVVVDNRSSGFLAAEAVAKAPPDGYTLLLNTSAWYTVTLFEKQNYDPEKDFAPITITSSTPNLLAIHPSLPVKSVRELITLAKSRPGELNYGNAGIGGGGQFGAEQLKSMAGVNIVSVPYKGSARAVTGLLGGEVQLIFSDFPPLEPHVKSGRLKALAVTSPQPSELFPGMPTMAQTLPGFVVIANIGVLAPAKTSPAIIARLNTEIVRLLKTPEAKERIFHSGSEVVGSTPDELAAWIKTDLARWAKIVKEAGLNNH
jgi:tripartite-type tricarboxylate transporter receptor subunit TctC